MVDLGAVAPLVELKQVWCLFFEFCAPLMNLLLISVEEKPLGVHREEMKMCACASHLFMFICLNLKGWRLILVHLAYLYDTFGVISNVSKSGRPELNTHYIEWIVWTFSAIHSHDMSTEGHLHCRISVDAGFLIIVLKRKQYPAKQEGEMAMKFLFVTCFGKKGCTLPPNLLFGSNMLVAVPNIPWAKVPRTLWP